MLYIEAAFIVIVGVTTLFGIRWLSAKEREND